jgi:hypothetical protein
MTEPDPGPEPPDPHLPFEQHRTLDPEKHPHPLRVEDVEALVPKEIG